MDTVCWTQRWIARTRAHFNYNVTTMRRLILLVCLLALHGSLQSTAQSAAPAGRALLISDIHLDPLADPSIVKQLIAAPVTQWLSIFQSSRQRSLSTYGSDSNYFLFSSALNAAAAQGPFDYIVFTGDALRHRFEAAFLSAGGAASEFPAFAAKTEQFVVQELQREFRAPVLAAIGNNDSDCGDYRISPNSSFLAGLANQLTVLTESPEAKITFRFGGFFSIPHPAIATQDIIVLNSVFWSSSYSSCGSSIGDPGSAELDWLSWKLYTAKILHRGVVLIMHIPPGMNTFNSSQGQDCKTGAPFWLDRYSMRFSELMQTYSDVVQLTFAGHTHMDDFRVLNTGTPSVPVRITLAISPIFHNNPAFSVLSYDLRTAAVSDITTYFISLSSQTPQWAKEYQFSTAYGMGAFNAPNLATVASGIRNGPARQTFEKYYAVSAPSPINLSNWPFYSCGQTEFTEANYTKCVCGAGAAPGSQ